MQLIETPDNSDNLTKQYITSINNYITLINNHYASTEFHERFRKRIDSETDMIKKEKLIKTHSNYKHFTKNIFNSFIKLAEQKHTNSLYCLGRIHEHGIGVEINFIKAWAWYNTAFAVEGIQAKGNLERVWKHLTWETELEAQKLSDQYTYLYTNITNTPSTTILR